MSYLAFYELQRVYDQYTRFNFQQQSKLIKAVKFFAFRYNSWIERHNGKNTKKADCPVSDAFGCWNEINCYITSRAVIPFYAEPRALKRLCLLQKENLRRLHFPLGKFLQNVIYSLCSLAEKSWRLLDVT